VAHVRNGLLVNKILLRVLSVVDIDGSSAGNGPAFVSPRPFAISGAHDLSIDLTAIQATMRVPGLTCVVGQVLEDARFFLTNTPYKFTVRKLWWTAARDGQALLRFCEVSARQATCAESAGAQCILVERVTFVASVIAIVLKGNIRNLLGRRVFENRTLPTVDPFAVLQWVEFLSMLALNVLNCGSICFRVKRKAYLTSWVNIVGKDNHGLGAKHVFV
jgi:hypothetical protein